MSHESESSSSGYKLPTAQMIKCNEFKLAGRLVRSAPTHLPRSLSDGFETGIKIGLEQCLSSTLTQNRLGGGDWHHWPYTGTHEFFSSHQNIKNTDDSHSYLQGRIFEVNKEAKFWVKLQTHVRENQFQFRANRGDTERHILVLM